MKIPGHIILSRKGWDSKAGGKPSPILPDGTLGTIPIPDSESGIRYRDLQFANGVSMGPVVKKLTGGQIDGSKEVHLDPDIRADIVRNRTQFVPAFGQCGASQTHLANQGVNAASAANRGDLFLFFGLYREVDEQWTYRLGKPNLHLIYGWLQIGEVHFVEKGVPKELGSHPHARKSRIVLSEINGRKVDNNTIYVARKTLSFATSIPGAGVFQRPFRLRPNDPRQLSKLDQPLCSRWRLPAFFRELSNMGKQPECEGDLWCPQRKGPGQEFVLNTSKYETEVEAWLRHLFQCAQG